MRPFWAHPQSAIVTHAVPVALQRMMQSLDDGPPWKKQPKSQVSSFGVQTCGNALASADSGAELDAVESTDEQAARSASRNTFFMVATLTHGA